MQDFEKLDKLIWRDGLTLIDFFASWCNPCRMMHPTIDRFEERMRGRCTVLRIDIDDREVADTLRRYNIRSVPTLMLFRHGEMLWRESGVVSYETLIGVFERFETQEHAIEQQNR